MMDQWWAWQFALVALATVHPSPSQGKNAEFLSPTVINNVVANPRTGRLYIGAVNALHQLSPDLEVESHTETGPRRDNRQCTPPVTEACEEAADTDNHNKLLLVHGAKDVLVVCGSVFRGICSLRNLSNVEHLLYFSDTKGEKSYVASAEEGVSVVGVMSYFTKDSNNFTVFLVRMGTGTHTLRRTHALRCMHALRHMHAHTHRRMCTCARFDTRVRRCTRSVRNTCSDTRGHSDARSDARARSDVYARS